MAEAKKIKVPMIQVFLIGDSSAEISGELVKQETVNEGTLIAVKDEGSDDTYITWVPFSQIKMIRYFDVVEE